MSEYIKKSDVIKTMENNSHIIEVYGTKKKMIDGLMMCCDLADLEVVELDNKNDKKICQFPQRQKTYELAHELAEDYFRENMMKIVGAKIINGYMYVKGGDNGFPHTRAHIKIDLKTNQIVEYYGAHDCPVRVSENVYE